MHKKFICDNLFHELKIKLMFINVYILLNVKIILLFVFFDNSMFYFNST